MEIREFLPADREKAAAVWLTAAVRSNPALPEEFWLARYRALWRALPCHRTLLAAVDGEIEGVLVLAAPEEIGALGVGPSCRRKGHASALLAAAGAGPLSVWVPADNTETIEFLQKRGFAAGQTRPCGEFGQELQLTRR